MLFLGLFVVLPFIQLVDGWYDGTLRGDEQMICSNGIAQSCYVVEGPRTRVALDDTSCIVLAIREHEERMKFET